MDAEMLDVFFASDEVQPGVFLPRSLLASERLSAVARTIVDLEYEHGEVEAGALLRKPAAVVMAHRDGTVLRRFDGWVTRVEERMKASAGRHQFRVTLESPLAYLLYWSDAKIFQEKSSQDIVSEILQGAGLGSLDVEWRLSAPPPSREVCTQYLEISFDFISRLLEEDGITYFWEPGKEGAKLVFADGNSAFQPGLSAPLRYVSAAGMEATEYVHTVGDRSWTRVSRVSLRDHDFKRPALDLDAEAENESPFGREHYEFPGRYVEPGEGARRAKIWLEAEVAAAQRVVASGSAFPLGAGHQVTLEDCPDPSLAGDYVVRGIVHHWRNEPGRFELRSELDLLPAGVPFRPPRTAARPAATGPTVATVTGPAGEEIHCDEFGRIKVQFWWDRFGQNDDKSSAWVRVAQMHTSGSVAIPRIGWEVLVDFEDGDPDKPIALGRLYNGAKTPPCSLPGEKTTSAMGSYSSPGGGGLNEFKMNDGAGGEVFSVYAQKDMNLCIANDKTVDIVNDNSVGVAADQSITVGADETIMVGADDANTVGGSQSWTVGASRTKTVTGNDGLSVSSSRSTSIGASHTTMTPMTVSVSTPASLSETIGGSCIEAAGLGVSIAALGTTSATVGGAKIEACVAGKADTTLGARSASVGGALINVAGGDTGTSAKGVKATNVGGLWMCAGGGKSSITAAGSLTINVGGAFAALGTEVVLEVGGSKVSLSGGAAVVTSSTIELKASGPNAEVSAGIASK